jgi:hypothetical protein
MLTEGICLSNLIKYSGNVRLGKDKTEIKAECTAEKSEELQRT